MKVFGKLTTVAASRHTARAVKLTKIVNFVGTVRGAITTVLLATSAVGGAAIVIGGSLLKALIDGSGDIERYTRTNVSTTNGSYIEPRLSIKIVSASSSLSRGRYGRFFYRGCRSCTGSANGMNVV